MRKDTDPAINDIRQCLDYAHLLAKRIKHTHNRDRNLFLAFASLAGDETVGFLAYVIWHGRSKLLSDLRTTPLIRYDAETRARHTRPYMARGKCCLR